MVNALVVRKNYLPDSQGLCAAQYVRMSTNKQRYSIQNQAAVIAAYAHAHNLKIVRTYADEGESGLHIKNRAGLQQLIADVNGGEANFSHVLVYDVSRWGRFQDTDESAHYEFVCKRAGVSVAYCAEKFDNDGSMLSSIVKNLKRVMAAEYSRELSAKVHAGQSRIARLGFRPGAPISYALQRELVDENLRSKGILKRGESKFLTTDRVRVKIGDADEVAVVRWIFDQCLKLKTDAQIARELNQKVVPTATGRPWNRGLVSGILRNEAYIGNIVYNRESRKLGTPTVHNPSDLWVRGERCVEAIVQPEVFQRAKKRIDERRLEIPEGEMLLRLRKVLHKKGRLSPTIIESTIELPSVDTYIHHFGSIRNTYRLIGYTPERDYTFIDAESAWAEATTNLARQVSARLKNSGRHVRTEGANDELCIDRKDRVLFRAARSYALEGHLTQWRVPRIDRPHSKWIVAICLTDENATVLDYVLIPTKAIIGKYPKGYMRFTEKACVRLGFRRFGSVEALALHICQRHEPARHKGDQDRNRRAKT
jgi:DNA invertase Pin-like site-specific DNA recombinase